MAYLKTDLKVLRDNLTLRGHAWRPDTREKLPALILCHGFMDHHMGRPAPYVETALKAGYAVFAFDFSGGCLKGTSDGETTDMSVLTEVADLKAVIAHVKALDGIDENNISLMGQSQGGFVAAITAVQMPEIRQLILFYPALCIPDDARRGSMMAARFDPENVPDTFHCGPMKLGRRYVTDVIGMDAMAAIRAYQGRVLLIHGDKDRIVNVRYAVEAAKVYEDSRPRRLTTVLMEGAGHGFDGREEDLAKALIGAFLSGRDGILNVDVTLTGRSLEVHGLDSVLTLPFTGSSASPWFKGEIQPGAADVQKRHGTKTVRFCADYVLSGTDYTGKACSVHIVNVDEGSGWKPTVETDSQALQCLHGDCVAVFEMRQKGPQVRIFAKT